MGTIKQLTLFAVIAAMILSPMNAFAQGKKGGGTITLTNPAFIYQDEADGGLFRITSNGSSKVRLTSNSVSKDRAATWSPDMNPAVAGHQGSITFFRPSRDVSNVGYLMAVPSDGSGPPVVVHSFPDPLAPNPERENYSESLSWSPDGSHIIYSSQGSIWGVTVATGQVQEILGMDFDPIYSGFWHPCFSPDLNVVLPGYQGKIAFTLFGNGPIGGRGSDIGIANVQIDSLGKLTVDGAWELVVNTHDWAESQPVWSNDGQRLAMLVMPGIEEPLGVGRTIDVLHLASGITWTAASVIDAYVRPSWSPDSQFIGFSDARKVGTKWTTDIFYVRSDGSAVPVNVTKTDSTRALENQPAWNPAWVDDLP